MVKLVQIVDTFSELHYIFDNCGYSDDLIKQTIQYTQSNHDMKGVYDDILNDINIDKCETFEWITSYM